MQTRLIFVSRCWNKISCDLPTNWKNIVFKARPFCSTTTPIPSSRTPKESRKAKVLSFQTDDKLRNRYINPFGGNSVVLTTQF